MNLPLCLSGERKSFAGCRGFFKKPPCWSRPQTAGQKPHSLNPCREQVSISQKWYNCYTILNGIYSPLGRLYNSIEK